MRTPSRLPPSVDYPMLIAIVGLFLLPTLHWPPIGLHGEAREALVVRDIAEHGNWILPHRNGDLPSKPPLYHWIAAVAVGAFGSSDASMRLPSALAAAALACAVYALGVAAGGRLTGWLSIGALFGMVNFWKSACEVRVDMVFAASIGLALAGFFVWYQARGWHRWGRVLFYLGCACGVLGKGPAGVALPWLVVIGFLGWQRDLAALRRLWSWPLAGTMLILDAGWYWLAYRIGGEAFIKVQLLHENWDRFVGRGSFERITRRHSASLLAQALLTEYFPWNLALVDGARRAWRNDGLEPVDRFLHAWWVVFLVVFTFSVGKRPVYLLPIMPAIAILAGRAIAHWLASRSTAVRLRLPGGTRAEIRPLVAVALLLAVADAAAFGGSVAFRHVQASRRSLAAFAEEVRGHVPMEEPLYASPGLRAIDLMVVAYRLDRPIERRRPACDARYVIVPDSDLESLAARGVHVVASSGRPQAPVSLVREPDAALCRGRS